MLKAEAIGRLGDVTKLEEPVSGMCRILSMGEPSHTFPRSPQDRRSRGATHWKFLKSPLKTAAAVEKKCDVLTRQSNNFGISRKRFKPLID